MDMDPGMLFEFVLVLKGNPRGIQRLPDSFVEYVAGDDRPRTMHLREASCGYYRWIVDVIYDARDKMYLNIGWGKFPRHHSLEAGFILLFSYFGDRDMSVKVFDETRCRRDYHGDNTRTATMMKSVVSSQRIRAQKFLDVRLIGRTNKGTILPLHFSVWVTGSMEPRSGCQSDAIYITVLPRWPAGHRHDPPIDWSTYAATRAPPQPSSVVIIFFTLQLFGRLDRRLDECVSIVTPP
ncbi:hypothetical protein QYE76_038409 [Lolium multiflorum]|uniref:TF-B3 domain-containing protein n=1 Tax=Lolium multiflorum TaxID=4521 RepID=A0AAD8T9J8_LOLMU|nr:hypothetical protein QYE76_038409 [Lolium multiflorum]